MRFLLSGYYGFGNAGDEAVLASLLQGLRQRFPEAELCVLSSAPGTTSNLYGVEAAQRWSVAEVWRALGRSDLLIQGGGSLLQDATSKVSPVYYLGILRMARLRRVPSVIFAQGFGPLNTSVLRRWAASEFRRAAAVTLRDAASVEQVRSLPVTSPEPTLVGDPAVLLEPDLDAARTSLREAEVDLSAGYALLTLRQWPQTEQVVEACGQLVRHLHNAHGLETVLVPFQEPEDLAPLQQVVSASPGAHLLTGLGRPQHFVGLVSLARLAVCMRLHGIIFAAGQQVPAIGLSYDPKLDAFAARAGQPVLACGSCTGDALCAVVDSALTQAQTKAADRAVAAAEVRSAAETAFEVLAEVVKGLR
ncbi:polysaccharide pyruvyl transferase CsaB [bacterium]|nr:polysaccharide pyruvyl transferase CsaB [bacterium]MCE5217043.1 polysaccharide pyruvyl transferase CsaB [bacterium]